MARRKAVSEPLHRLLSRWTPNTTSVGRSSPAKEAIFAGKLDRAQELDVFPGEASRGPGILETARQQWLNGDWEGLSKLTQPAMEGLREKAVLALVVGSAWQQLNDHDKARQFIVLARKWGAEESLIAKILLAGVHSTLGRAAAICGNERQAINHFRHAILSGPDELQQLSLRRCKQETADIKKKIASSLLPAQPPIFIHSLWRAGSTYVFNAFRREEAKYWAYQEPLHEVALRADETSPRILDGISSEHLAYLRHPLLARPYFYELSETYASWQGLIAKPMILASYFGAEGTDDLVVAYFEALIRAAPHRAVIQECRTSQRIPILKASLGGVHLYLSRNPWDQWYSYFTHPNFLATLQVLLSADNLPPPVEKLRVLVGHERYIGTSIEDELAFYCGKPLSGRQSYMVFFMLWSLGLLAGRSHADLIIDMDEMTISPPYRKHIFGELLKLGVDGVDFSDCSMPRSVYSDSDWEFFEGAQGEVRQILEEFKYSDVELGFIDSKLQACRLSNDDVDRKALVTGLARLRQIITGDQRFTK